MSAVATGSGQYRGRRGARVIACSVAWMLLLASTGIAADVRARVEPRVIDELETTRLILRTSGRTVVALDLGPLHADFEVLGTQTQSQYQSVGGVVEAWVEYQITLRPRRSGQLTIAPLRVGDALSNPVVLDVRPLQPAVRAAIDRMVFFEQSLTRERVYVGAETVLVRRLYYSSAAQIYSDLPIAPEVENALILPIGETRTGSVTRDGERYGVIEQRYAIFPQRPGTLTIPPISLTTSVRLQDGARVRRTATRVATEPATLEVLPIPAEYPADVPWLPAIDISLNDDWTPDLDRLTTGEPVTRRIEVSVIGNLAAAISPVESNLPDTHFRQYPNPPELSDSRVGPSIVGIRRSDYAVLPTNPGSVALPALAVIWWDVDAARVRVTEVPARLVSISGVPTAEPAPPTGSDPRQDAAAETPPEARSPPLAIDLIAWRARFLNLLPWLAGALLLAGGCRWALRRRPDAPAHPSRVARWREALQRPLALRRLRSHLHRCARRGDPRAIEAALDAYLRCWYRATSTSAARRCFRAAGHGPVLDALAATRFARTPGAPADVDAALTAALAALAAARGPAPEVLPPLYPRS